MIITKHYGQPSYVVKNEKVKIVTSIRSACTMPYFSLGEREVCPYWVAPWWNNQSEKEDILATLRGNFICVARTEDNNNPEHGHCCATTWELISLRESGSAVSMTLNVQEPAGGNIQKTLYTDGVSTVVYEQNKLKGLSGEYNVGNHPCLKLPKNKENGYFSMTKPEKVVTPTIYCDSPEQGGYMLFPRSAEIDDWEHAKTIYGEELNLTHHPAKPGTVDLLMMVHKPQLVFCAFVNKEEDYVYYQLKNSKDFPYILFWMFSGGRHYEPWNGTLEGCLGVEDCADFLFFMKNDLDEETGKQKYNTSINLSKNIEYDYRQIYGVESLSPGLERIENVLFLDDGIELIGNDDIRIKAQVDWKFLV